MGWGVRGHVAQWRPQTRGLFGCGGLELRPFPNPHLFQETQISKMGQRDLRRLLITGAMATVSWAVRRGTKDPWLARMLARKPRMLVAVALANRMARIAWALMTNHPHTVSADCSRGHK